MGKNKTWWCSGVDFDGTNDYVEVPFDASMNPTADFTVNAWVKTGGSSTWQSAVTSRSATTTCDDTPNLSAGYMLYIQPDEEWSFWNGNCTLLIKIIFNNSN